MLHLPELLILRHGETEWNREGRFQGGLDSPLTALGRDQARAQGRILRSLDLTGFRLLQSPQGRAMATAQIALDGSLPTVTDPRLAEIGMGAWSGLRREEIKAQMPDLFLPGAPPMSWYGKAPDGESMQTFAARVTDILSELDGPSVIVTHGATSRMLRSIALGLSPDAFAYLGGGQGVIYRVAPGAYEKLTEGGVEPQTIPARF